MVNLLEEVQGIDRWVDGCSVIKGFAQSVKYSQTFTTLFCRFKY